MGREHDDRIRIDAALSMTPRDDRPNIKNQLIARDVAREELGRDPASPQPEYVMDREAIDRLLFHTRQDVAHALLNTITLLDNVRKLERRSRNNRIAIAILLATVAAWIWWRWPGVDAYSSRS
jgi:hypothetical protein